MQFSNTLNHDYVWDDSIVITSNERVKKGINGIPELFTRYNTNNLSDRYGFRPLILSSYAIEVSLFGLNPKANHAFNIFYFGVLCIVLFLLLKKIFVGNIWLPLLITLLYISHPLHSEVVANIKSRDEIFAMLFGCLSLLLFLTYAETNAAKYLLLAFAAFLLGLMSKESNLIYAVLIPSALVWFTKLSYRQIMFLTLPLGVLSAIIIPGTIILKLVITPIALMAISILYFLYHKIKLLNIREVNYTAISSFVLLAFLVGALTLYSIQYVPFISSEEIAQKPIQQIPDDENGLYLEHKVLGNPLMGLPVGSTIQVMANSLLIIKNYTQLFFYPHPLVYYYGFNQISLVFWNMGEIVLYALLYVLFLVAIFCLIPNFKALSFAMLFFAIAIIPYTHILKLLDDFMADRYMFAPSLGLCMSTILILWKYGGLSVLFESKHIDKANNYFKFLSKGGVSLLALIVLMIGFSSHTYSRNKVWKDNFSLVSNDLENLNNCARAHYYYANECFSKYKASQDNDEKQLYQNKVIEHYTKSITINKSSFFARINLGKAYATFGMYDDAFRIFKETIVLFSEQTVGYYNIGHLHFTLKNFKEAIPYLERANQIRPKHRETYADLAWAYFHTGNTDAAINLLLDGIKLMPEFLSNYGNLSAIHFELGNYTEAMNCLMQALTLDPMGEPIYDMIIYQYTERGEEEKAKYYYDEAVGKGLLKERE